MDEKTRAALRRLLESEDPYGHEAPVTDEEITEMYDELRKFGLLVIYVGEE